MIYLLGILNVGIKHQEMFTPMKINEQDIIKSEEDRVRENFKFPEDSEKINSILAKKTYVATTIGNVEKLKNLAVVTIFT